MIVALILTVVALLIGIVYLVIMRDIDRRFTCVHSDAAFMQHCNNQRMRDCERRLDALEGRKEPENNTATHQ